MYGLTKETRKLGLQKIKKQKEFLENNYFTVGNNIIKMSDLIKNAYHNSNRYIAEVNQRVWSLYHYANNRGLKCIFGTITLPTEYHKKIGNKKSNPKYANRHLIQDIDRIYDIKTKKEVFNYFQYKDYTPNAGAKQLSYMFKKMLDLRFLSKDIDKEDKCYFRVYEPHKDGTPHLHFSLFVPEDKLNLVHEKISNYFNNNYPNLRTDFQVNINNPVAYLMKYILKTFDDLRDNPDNISDLSLWYITNKITRFYTSRTLISLDIFRALNGRYDLLELTYMYKNRELIVYLDTETNKLASIYDSVGMIYNKKQIEIHNSNSRIKLNYEKKKNKPTPIIFIQGEQYIQDKEGNLKPFEPITPINKYTNLDLYTHYNQMNHSSLDSYDINHYYLVHNELVNRQMINSNIIELNQYEVGF